LTRESADPGEGMDRISAGRGVAAAGVFVLACSLPLLPLLVASGVATGFGVPLAVGASGGLAALLGGGKLAVVVAGLVWRPGGAHPEARPAASD
jgi:hypothetical protein